MTSLTTDMCHTIVENNKSTYFYRAPMRRWLFFSFFSSFVPVVCVCICNMKCAMLCNAIKTVQRSFAVLMLFSSLSFQFAHCSVSESRLLSRNCLLIKLSRYQLTLFLLKRLLSDTANRYRHLCDDDDENKNENKIQELTDHCQNELFMTLTFRNDAVGSFGSFIMSWHSIYIVS